jgi:hypothetical protein
VTIYWKYFSRSLFALINSAFDISSSFISSIFAFELYYIFDSFKSINGFKSNSRFDIKPFENEMLFIVLIFTKLDS